MKRVFATLAAAAMSLSVLAFAGCEGSTADENTQNTDSVYTPDSGADKGGNVSDGGATGGKDKTDNNGLTDGNYREVTPLQMAAIVSGINFNKVKEVSGLGITTELSGSVTMGDIVSASGSLVLDYKIGFGADGIAGAGTAAVKADFSHSEYPDRAVSVDLTGSIYNDIGFIYATATGDAAGEVLSGESVKVNLLDILGVLSETGEDSAQFPSLGFEIGGFLNIANLLANSSAFGVKVYVDTDDGLKFKLSLTEKTIWAAIAAADGSGITTGELDGLKDKIFFNSFRYDVYFALDGNGRFSRAGVVNDIEVTIDSGVFGNLTDTADTSSLPAVTVKIKDLTEIYAFNGVITLPDSVTDGSYIDMTQSVLGFLEKYAEN